MLIYFLIILSTRGALSFFFFPPQDVVSFSFLFFPLPVRKTPFPPLQMSNGDAGQFRLSYCHLFTWKWSVLLKICNCHGNCALILNSPCSQHRNVFSPYFSWGWKSQLFFLLSLCLLEIWFCCWGPSVPMWLLHCTFCHLAPSPCQTLDFFGLCYFWIKSLKLFFSPVFFCLTIFSPPS